MVAAYSLRQSKNCVKRLGQFFFQFCFSGFTFSISFRQKSNQEKESMTGAVLRDMSMYKIFTFNSWHNIPHLSPVWSFGSDFSTLLQEFSLCFAVFLSHQGPVSQESGIFSGLFRMPRFPLGYLRNAEVPSHQTSQSFKNVMLRHQLFKTSGL